ncbi:MAG: hypothetical protein LBU98_00365 [Alistipes sp.]|jgi:beta-galactosidase|nr:hypothetical protein [Alistipes sp.]
MKNTVSALFAILIPAIAIPAAAQIPRHLDPTVVAVNKELPRGEAVSHDSKADAVGRTPGASKYLQPLTEWTRTESADAVRYRTRFRVPFGWIDRRQFLCVGRTSGSFDVMVNGAPAAYSQTGSTPGEFDITDASKEGANELEIVIWNDLVSARLENNRPAVPPRLEGEVYIVSQPRVRVRDVAVSTRMEESSGLLELGVILKSHLLNPHDYTVFWELLNPAGEIVAEGRKDARLEMRREDTVTFFANIPRIVPWSHEEPRLYTLFIKTQNEGRFREYLSFRVGFRNLGLDDDGTMTLNGMPLELDMREFVPPGDAAEMREALMGIHREAMAGNGGAAGVMLRGAPPSREFYALCDSLGIYVVGRADIDTRAAGESRTVGGNPSNDPAWKAAYLDRVLAMYHTSKNHPSVSMFSLGSEAANGYNLYESYLALKRLERHRPVIYTDGGGEWNSDLVLAAGDYPTLSAAAASSAGWLTLEAIDVAAGRFRLSNLRRITPFTGEAAYRIVAGRRNVVSGGSLPVEVMPGESVEFTVPVSGVREGKAYTVAVEIAGENPAGDYLPDDDPNLKIFRRLDRPLDPANRAVVVAGEFGSGER